MTTITKQNLAFVLSAIGRAGFEERPIPKLRDPWDVRVHVAQTGIYGSDLRYYDTGRIGDFILTTPIILGHESSGTVVEIDSAVENLKVGDRVAIELGVPCRHYNYYRSGSTTCVPTPFLLLRHHGMTVVVFYCGPIGVLCRKVSKVYGAKKVIGVDISQGRLDFARSYWAADDTFLPPKKLTSVETEMLWCEQLAKMIKEKFNLGEGPDVVIEATGNFVTKKGGTYVQAGIGKEIVDFPITIACIRDFTIRRSMRYTTSCYPAAVELVASGKIDVKPLITNIFKFEDTKEALELVRQKHENVIKVLIQGVQN
ncbi:GroES-like protein [Hyaloscypha hepaticicola]|uniref:GroES-like protein n=1 Tax=Hyaloscypha hepaticicola TaxID=2082293 RepID=A0A2J6Q190_9HELO|nr:GroES-like protein [Hyaloscypha hepaticicola]